jgi:hypothetical protein
MRGTSGKKNAFQGRRFFDPQNRLAEGKRDSSGEKVGEEKDQDGNDALL